MPRPGRPQAPAAAAGAASEAGMAPPETPRQSPRGPPGVTTPAGSGCSWEGPGPRPWSGAGAGPSRSCCRPLPESALELDPDSVYGPGLDFPRRPPWSFGMSAAELRQREEGTFGDFLRDIGDIPGVAPFEHNLETWRQLWRVLEMSDVILLIADARHPALSVPPALASHITQELGKGLILILNKVDLTPPSVAVAWCHLLRGHFGVTHVVPFTSTPGTAPTAGLQSRQKRGGSRGRWGRALGPRRLLEACQDLVGDNVDLSSWRARLERPEEEQEEQEEPQGRAEHEEEEEEEGEGDTAPPRQWERFRHGVLTLGCVGLPNAGKSSVLNALLGRSAVGVSRAPGRTRYFQTHYLCGSVRLCDCPGLVFPSRAPPELQVLAGVYPIAQLQDPYSAVGFLCSRLALPPLLQLRPPSGAGWTAWDICEAWAEKRGYKTARAARNDVARAANGILRLAAEGRLRLSLRPPGYTLKKDFWEHHPDTAAMAAMLGGVASPPAPPGDASSSEEEEGEESEEATPPPSPAPNPFALLGEDEC
ncbi:guanine nucleotide-binding protein-like 1 isoform X2 [Catharus ustulatus]|uniref:guanine nucleotide-binding protein-like 1 isoform X2 n=1 Tax=Catharus ustulatus TaxID=91951 RepID=UPI00140CB4E3|nr:guanine nucleotide-binding protein-like 1 isoform X2 [Catharus ustulatus]